MKNEPQTDTSPSRVSVGQASEGEGGDDAEQGWVPGPLLLTPRAPCPARCPTALYPTFPGPPLGRTRAASPAARATGAASPGPRAPSVPTALPFNQIISACPARLGN